MDVLPPHPLVTTPPETARPTALDAWARTESKSLTGEADLRQRFAPDASPASPHFAAALIAKGLLWSEPTFFRAAEAP